MLTQKKLKEMLHYEPNTGIFTWLKPKQGRRKNGVIGHKCNGYVYITISRKIYLAHRLAWFYVYGAWPENQLDHEKHARDDNRIRKLSEATHQENQKNRSLNKNNKSGICGVSWHKQTKKWRASISVDKNVINLGFFVDKFEAICSRLSANNKYGFHANHGK